MCSHMLHIAWKKRFRCTQSKFNCAQSKISQYKFKGFTVSSHRFQRQQSFHRRKSKRFHCTQSKVSLYIVKPSTVHGQNSMFTMKGVTARSQLFILHSQRFHIIKKKEKKEGSTVHSQRFHYSQFNVSLYTVIGFTVRSLRFHCTQSKALLYTVEVFLDKVCPKQQH